MLVMKFYWTFVDEVKKSDTVYTQGPKKTDDDFRGELWKIAATKEMDVRTMGSSMQITDNI